jgi:N-acetylglucosamine malate deacetylase 1
LLTAKRVLVLAPHTDDAELGCGATIARLVGNDCDVFVAAFSTAEASLPPGSPPDQLKLEFFSAMKVLGVPAPNLIVSSFPVRHLAAHRQEVLESLVQLRRDLSPELILLPSGSDVHQDHQVVHMEGLRAFKELSRI